MILRRALSAGSLIKTGRGDTIKFYERSRFRDHFPAKIVKLFSKVPNTAATWLGDWRWHSKSALAGIAVVAAGFECRARWRR